MIMLASEEMIVSDIRGVLDEVAKIKRGMYHRQPGCACDDNGLCAHHAEVRERLQTASDDLAKAIKAALDDR